MQYLEYSMYYTFIIFNILVMYFTYSGKDNEFFKNFKISTLVSSIVLTNINYTSDVMYYESRIVILSITFFLIFYILCGYNYKNNGRAHIYAHHILVTFLLIYDVIKLYG